MVNMSWSEQFADCVFQVRFLGLSCFIVVLHLLQLCQKVLLAAKHLYYLFPDTIISFQDESIFTAFHDVFFAFEFALCIVFVAFAFRQVIGYY